MSVPHWLQRLLAYHGVPYREHIHSPVFSASHLAHIEHVTGRRVAKVVFLNARNHPVMVVLPAVARVDVERVRSVLGEPDLRLATEQEIAGWFKGCKPGCIPPFRLRSDLRILLDRGLAHLGEIVMPGGAPDVSISVRFRDWYRAVHPGVGRYAAGDIPGPKSARGASVLVVEDESELNHLLCELLQREGVVCQGVVEGRKALETARHERPSAILLDLMLPDMSGLEMVQQLRRQGSLKRIPWIVLTALDDEAARQRSRELGADAYLTKPLEPQMLIDEVRELLVDARA
ncbi:MAG TPA: response regulator [Gemmataceae bacterium]|jgi:CheY-like chemotaxis protein/prolyl-tRNA editing enzyme YbaK/EbsC (Cys-tRNA(Pro) deacylase)